jgi:hypothetical protein
MQLRTASIWSTPTRRTLLSDRPHAHQLATTPTNTPTSATRQPVLLGLFCGGFLLGVTAMREGMQHCAAIR